MLSIPDKAEPIHCSEIATLEAEWWRLRPFLALVCLLTAVPLVWPSLPPLIDLPGHVGRYRIELDLALSTSLQHYYGFRWAIMPNLGFDLLIVPFAPMLGLEPAVKLITLSVPVLTTAGIFWVSRLVHGKLPSTTFFAVPLVYGYPFMYGFLNFSLSMAAALLAFGLWLQLGQGERLHLRAALFLPTACIVWLIHIFGWGILASLIFSSELISAHDTEPSWPRAIKRAGLKASVLALPLVLMVLWHSGHTGLGIVEWSLYWKPFALFSALRDRWLLWDCLSVGVLVTLIGSAIFDDHMRFARSLVASASILMAIFLAIPSSMLGGSYADMRLAPFVLMIATMAIREQREDPSSRRAIATLGLLFVATRLVGNTISLAVAGAINEEELTALRHIPPGSAVLSLVGQDCHQTWYVERDGHLGSLVISRNRGFSNDQWAIPGQQLLKINYLAAGEFMADPSQQTYTKDCVSWLIARGVKPLPETAEHAIGTFPRSAFDYVWLINPGDFSSRPHPGLSLVWAGRRSLVFKINRPRPKKHESAMTPALVDARTSGSFTLRLQYRPPRRMVISA